MMFKTISTQRHQLAEGPHWCAETARLFWVDIPMQQVWCWDSLTGQHQHWPMPEKVSAVFTTDQKNALLVVLATRVAVFNCQTHHLETLCTLDDDRPSNRGNDAKVAPDGSLWVGTMDDNETLCQGRLWRVTADGQKQCLLDNVGIANTFAWDEPRGCMYFADSMRGQIHRFPYPAFRDVRTESAFARTPDGSGPDGSTIDEDGALWNAQWDGQRIVRYLPDGSEDRILSLPFARPTSCAFGGPEGKTLFITSASVGLEDQLAEQPLAGQVVALEVAHRGAPNRPFALRRS